MIGANILFLLLLDGTVQAVNKVCHHVLEMCCRLQLKNNTKRSNGEIMYMAFKMIDTSNSMSG